MLSGSKIKQIRKNLYIIKNPGNLSGSKIKEIEKDLELEKCLSKLKNCHDYDDNEYRGIRNVRSFFNQSFDRDYYKPMKTMRTFSKKNNYAEYESKWDKDKKFSPKEYLDMIRPYLHDVINDHKARGEWKIQLIMLINFISHKDSNDISIIYTKSDNIEIMMGSETDEIIEELFKSLLQRFQKGLEESMKKSDFVFDGVDLLYYKLHKTSLKRTWSSYIDSQKWLKDKK